VIRARFRLCLPEDVWVAEVSREFPDATFRLLTGVPLDDRSLELGEVVADDPEAAAAAIRDHPDVVAFERLHADDRRALTQYEAAEQRLYEFLWDSSFPPEFPLAVEDGEMVFEVTATREQFDAFGAALDDGGLAYELLSVVHTDEHGSLLTDSQREAVATAQRMGYFEVPRECSLADVADAIGVDASTASETIRRGTARVVDQFLAGDR